MAETLPSFDCCPQVPADELIVPGQRIGRWTLQLSIEDLERMNGPARRTMFRAGGGGAEDSVRDFTVLTWEPLGLKVATTDGKTVDVVLIHTAPYRTEYWCVPPILHAQSGMV